MQKIVATVEGAYIANIRNCTTKSIPDNRVDVLTCLQENYGQLITHELLKGEDIVKKTTYHLRDPITTVFYDIKDIIEIASSSEFPTLNTKL